jgi:PIN domain nuclease of toxin-antitoxin system
MILLDTHVVLWWRAAGDRLSARATRAIAAAEQVLISPISCWEIATLVRLGRVRIDRDPLTWVRDLFSDERIAVAPLSPQAASEAGLLVDLHGDPADRLLFATARDLVVPLVTKDQRLRDYARAARTVRTIW